MSSPSSAASFCLPITRDYLCVPSCPLWFTGCSDHPIPWGAAPPFSLVLLQPKLLTRNRPSLDPWVTPSFPLGHPDFSTGSPKFLPGSPKPKRSRARQDPPQQLV